jgi:chromosome segregation protein
MRLKRLVMRGFKSFADKTELEFAPGVTAVVGPNGGGKSNLADAIKWVLGEQRIKMLRGSRLDDLIFAGTRSRRSLGLAEVSLVFDNEDGSFSLPFSEVEVMRRTFRSGESEYHLNGSPCRLRDIQDLFLDTGIGKDDYSFIGQGRIDALLAARPEDRRAIFEEAAGIAKYKARKQEASSKLQDTEAALTRVDDILGELELQRQPLLEEAARARRYLDIEERRRAVERDLLLYELNMADRRRQRDQRQMEQLKEQSSALQNGLLTLETDEEQLRLRALAVQDELDRLNQQLIRFSQQVDKLESEERLQEARFADQASQLKALQDQERQMEARQTELQQEQTALAARLQALHQSIAEKDELLKQRQAEMQALSRDNNDQELAAAEAARSRAAELLQEAELEAQVLGERLTRLREEQQQLLASYTQAGAAAAAADEELQLRRQELQTARAAHQEQLARQQTLLDQQEKLSAELSRLRRLKQGQQQELAAAESRFRLLRDVVDGMEGYQRGVRALLTAQQQGRPELRGLVGVVGDLITVSAEMEVAIEAALGGSMQFLVVETEQAARQAIDFLKRNRAGRATFLPLDAVRPRPQRAIELQAARLPGALGFAVDLIEYEPRLQPIMSNLLGNILAVENLDLAIAIARRTGHQVRMVTLEGDLLMPGGSLSGGSRQRQGAGILGRQRELTQLTERRNQLRSGLADLERKIGQAEQQAERLTAELRRCQGDVARAQGNQQELESRQAAQQLVVQTGEARLAELAQAREKLNEQLAAAEAELTQAEERLKVQQAQRQEAEARLQHWRQASAGLEERRLQLMEKCHQLEVELTGLREQLTAAEREAQGLAERAAEVQRELDALRQEAAAISQSQTAAAKALQRLASEKGEQQAGFAATQAQVAGKKAEAGELQEQLELTHQQVRDARQALEDCRSQVYTVEFRLARVESECENLQERLAREFGIASRDDVHSTLSSRGEGETELAALQDQLLELGPVRVSSIQELERLEERIDFQRTQEKDLRESRHSLEQIIAQMDRVMGQRFLDSFAQVRRAFQRVFRELFDGGEAELKLLEPNRPLETGIEIDVQPPGKKLQNISLLSGGERALTAIAILCAVLEVKPPPFCVLDEIDAALDDANIRRLMRVITRLAERTQFIMITHSRETMLAAGNLYGVTMPEQGVSQLISVKLKEEDNIA